MSMIGRAGTALRRVLPGKEGRSVDNGSVHTLGTRTIGERACWMLGLQRQPFRDDAAPDELFRDDAIAMPLNALADQLSGGLMLPILRGEAGSGKTSMLIQLMARTGDDYHYFVIRGDPQTAAERVVVDMLRVLVRPVPADSGECFRELARQMRGIVADERPGVLVVDDAHAVSDLELDRLLSVYDKLRGALGGRFRLLLAADPAIEPRLSNLHCEQLDTGEVFTSNVRPLSRNRIPAYLGHRLAMAGYSGELPIEEETLDALASGGATLPRQIEQGAASAINGRWPD